MPFEVPEGWVWCKLEEICHIAGRIGFRGYTKEDLVNKGNGAITLSPSNIIDGEMNYSKCTYISWKKYEESPEIQICNGDILLVKTGSSFGKCAFVRNLPQEATINPQFVVIKYIGCNKEYLTFVLQSQYARNNYDSFVLGTAIPTFTQAALGDMLIPLPPIHEQNNIVKEVKYREVLINIINCNQEDLASSIEQTKSKILDLAIHGKLVPQDPNDEPAIELLKRINPDFTPCDNGHYPQLPDSWSTTTLKDLCESINGLWKGKKEPFIHVGVIRNANFTKDFKLDYSNIEYIDVEQRTFAKRHLMNGDLIVEKSGGSDNNPVGRTILYEGESGVFSFSNFTMVLRIKHSNTILNKFLYYYILAIYQKGAMRLMQTQTTGLHNLILDKFLSMPIHIPSYSEQERIVDRIETIFISLDMIMESL